MALDKATQDLLNDKNTIVIIPEYGAEYQIAYKFMKRNAPKAVSEARVFTELALGALQTDVSVVVVARNFENPIQEHKIDVGGKSHYPNRPEADLEAEVQVSDPVKVSKYWVRDSPMRPGRPDNAGILEALGKVIDPWHFEFVDKGEAKPELLKLFKV
jgi:hypothetical protein